jgi:hypothetical protein
MMRSWIHFTRGRFVRQARVGLGDLREEHLSRQGFAGPVAMLYRTDGPNEVVRFEGEYRASGRQRRCRRARCERPGAAAGKHCCRMRMPRWRSAGGARRCPIAIAIWRATSLLRTPRPRRVRNRVRARSHTNWATALPAEGDDLPAIARSRRQPVAGHRVAAASGLCEHEQVGRHTPIDPTMLEVPDVADYGWPKQDEYEVSAEARRRAQLDLLPQRSDEGGRMEGRSVPVQAQCPEHPADHVGSDSRSALVLGDLRGAGFCRVGAPGRSLSPISKRRNCPAITATSIWTRSCSPCRRRSQRPSPRQFPAYAAGDLARGQ